MVVKMGKFNISKIKGIDTDKDENVVDGLLSDVSRTQQSTMRKSEFVKYTDIIPNPRNKMSMNGLEELAQLIEFGGLEQPLVVRQREDGKYIILTGHRRFAAIGMLRQRNKWNSEDLVEVKIKDLDELDLPLTFEEKEMYAIMQTNRTREMTDADIAFEIKEWKHLISRLRAENVEFMTIGRDEDGNDIQRKIKGEKTQNLVAEQLGISSAQVAKFDKVDNQGSEALKNALYENKISISTASDVVTDIPKEKQDEVINKVLETKEADEKISKDDVLKVMHEEKHALTAVEKPELQNQKEDESLAGIKTITDKIFKADINDILKHLKKCEGVQMDEKEYATYLRRIDDLKKLIV